MRPFIKTVLGWFSKLKNIQVISLIIVVPTFTLISLGYMAVAVMWPWAVENQALQLEILRDGIMYVHGLLFISILALTAGLIRSVKIGAGAFSAELDLADEYDYQPPSEETLEVPNEGEDCPPRRGRRR